MWTENFGGTPGCPQPSGMDTYRPGFFYEEFVPVVKTSDQRGALVASIAAGGVPREYGRALWRALNACKVDTVPSGDPRSFTLMYTGANLAALPPGGTFELVNRYGQHIGDAPFFVVEDVPNAVSVTVPLYRLAVVVPQAMLLPDTQWQISTSFPLLHNREGPYTMTSGWNWRGSWTSIMTPLVVLP